MLSRFVVYYIFVSGIIINILGLYTIAMSA